MIEYKPQVKSNGCGKVFQVVAAGMTEHLFGTVGMAVCNMQLADADTRSSKLQVLKKVSSAMMRNRQRRARKQLRMSTQRQLAYRAQPASMAGEGLLCYSGG